MKLFICSDLHIDFLTPAEYEQFTFPEADAYLIAGDHMNGVIDRHYEWLLEKTCGIATYMSPGNHDYYGSNRGEAIQKMRALTKGSNIHIVCDEAVTLAPGLQLWASDFWTDLDVTRNVNSVLEVAKTDWDDFDVIDVIEVDQGSSRKYSRALTPYDMQRWNAGSVRKFVSFLDSTEDDVVLMSHHGLFPECLARDLHKEPLTAMDGLRTSDLRDVLLGRADAPLLVINGHIHRSNQQQLTSRTHLFCNPRGPQGVLSDAVVEVKEAKGQ
jgi:predicted phosphodiesterase